MPAEIKFTADDIQRMCVLYAAAHSFGDIAKLYDCATNTIRKRMLLAGVVPDCARSLRVKAIGRPSARKGCTWSESTHRKMREYRAATIRRPTRTGPHSAETKAKISAVLRARPRRISSEERKRREAIRQVCKRFVRRVLKATGRRKLIPSEQYLGYSTDDLKMHLGPRPPGAHVDHYVPIGEFIRRKIEVPAIINALPNLRWLDGALNQTKTDRVPHDADQMIARCIEDARRRGLA